MKPIITFSNENLANIHLEMVTFYDDVCNFYTSSDDISVSDKCHSDFFKIIKMLSRQHVDMGIMLHFGNPNLKFLVYDIDSVLKLITTNYLYLKNYFDEGSILISTIRSWVDRQAQILEKVKKI